MKRKGAIIVYLAGGLGNQMFQYAFGRYLSLKHNVPLKLDLSVFSVHNQGPKFTVRKYSLDIFNISAGIAQKSEVPLFYRRYFTSERTVIIDEYQRKLFRNPGEERHHHFQESAMLLGPNAYLDGYWQSEKYFKSIRDTIARDFTLREPLSNKSLILLKEIVNCNSVCMHVRRADYVGHKLHETVNSEYYVQSVALLTKDKLIDKIYIFSDDIDWCMDNLSFPYPTVFVGKEYAGEKDREHFALMSACKHFIIANSSFSWWAAWLGTYPGKQVIAPKEWFGDPGINTQDVTPPEWIRI